MKLLHTLQLRKYIKKYYHKGWLNATSGNFSRKIRPNKILITESGQHKNKLTCNNFLYINSIGSPLFKIFHKRTSAETLLHCFVYQNFKDANYVFHIHSKYSTLLSLRFQHAGKIILQNFEMLKALKGIDKHKTLVSIPVVNNSQNILDIVDLLKIELRKDTLKYNAFLIAGHGLYVWGTDILELHKYLEAIEFLLECYYLSLSL